MSFIIWIIFFWGLLYLVWVLWIKRGLSKAIITNQVIQDLPGVSILIPVRNEVNHIKRMLQSLTQQNYPTHLLELIFIDDHSEDQTLEILKQERFLYPDSHIIIEALSIHKQGKKQALTVGVKKAKFDYILTTDADCLHQQNWVLSMIQSHLNTHAKLTGGLVKYPKAQTTLEHIVSFESSLLNTHGLALSRLGHPILINGANLLFSKSIFEAIKGYQDHHHIASGDDIFLLHGIKKIYGSESVNISIETGTCVETVYPKTWYAFFMQRVRWAGKSKYYQDRDTIIISTYLGITSILWCFIMVWGLFFGSYTNILISLLCKSVLDHFNSLGSPIPQLKTTAWSILGGWLYPIYALGISFISFFIKPVWRGR